MGAGANEAAARELALRAARRTEWQLLGFVALVSLAGTVAVLLSAALMSSSSMAMWSLIVFLVFLLGTLMAVPLLAQNVIPVHFERMQLASIARGEHSLSSLAPYDFARVSPASIFLPIGLIGPLALTTVIVSRGPALVPLMAWVGGTLLLFSFAYHRVPNSRRSVKYAAFQTGTGLLGAAWSFGKDLTAGTIVITFALLIVSIACFALMRDRLRPTEPLTAGDASTERAFRWRRWSMAYGPQPGWGQLLWLVMRAVPILGDVLWAARIYSKERLARAPVLYLRSFAYADSARILGEVVAPAASRVAVVAALIHPSQTTASLNQRTHEAWTPLTFGVSNDQWREWYLKELESALAVVVDAGVLSEHTRWELDNAGRILGRDRVMVVGPAGTVGLLPDYWVIEYDTADLRAARNSLTQWLERVVASSFGVAHQSAARQLRH